MSAAASRTFGHLAAIFTIIVWGTTYISTKVLLTGFTPTEILMIRFVIGFLLLLVMHPHLFRFQGIKMELLFLGSALSGITCYYLLENIALTMTQASNVGVIICVAPFFTAFWAHLIWKDKAPLRFGFLIGFLIAIVGICLISFDGSGFSLSLKGDLLALLAALCWSVYSVLMRIIGKQQYSTIQVTRRFFEYAVLFMIPAMLFLPFHPNLTLLKEPKYLLNLLFLGVIASAVCFVSWNCSVRILGAVTTSVYIYLTPVVTLLTAWLILGETLSGQEWTGVALTMAGLILSEFASQQKKR